MELQDDPWLMNRISDALDAIRHADFAGLETELDLIAFAEDVLERYRTLLFEPDNHHNAFLCPYCTPKEKRD